jgi:hypothetical protein
LIAFLLPIAPLMVWCYRSFAAANLSAPKTAAQFLIKPGAFNAIMRG